MTRTPCHPLCTILTNIFSPPHSKFPLQLVLPFKIPFGYQFFLNPLFQIQLTVISLSSLITTLTLKAGKNLVLIIASSSTKPSSRFFKIKPLGKHQQLKSLRICLRSTLRWLHNLSTDISLLSSDTPNPFHSPTSLFL